MPQPMACCYKDEEQSSCSTTGKKDQHSNGKVLLRESPAFGFAQASTFTCGQQQVWGETKIKIENCSSPEWCCDASQELSFECCLLSRPDPSCMCHGEEKHQRS